jgi:hypothetical protein
MDRKHPKIKKSWRNNKWFDFAEKVKQRDSYKCLKCERTESEVVLQVHHEVYRDGKAPWEYSLSDCITLCRGCHAREHNLIEPDRGWYLLAVEDLGDLSGVCERVNCGNSIRYEHQTYHPKWGYKVVGSSCIEHLTQKDKKLSGDILKIYKQISKFISESEWLSGYTQKGKRYIEAKYKHHLLRVYGKENNYSFQVALKEKGVRWYDYQKVIFTQNKGIEEVQELAFIMLKGKISEDEEEINLLRDIYRTIK